MPTPVIVILVVVGAIIFLGSITTLIMYYLELQEERRNEHPGWDQMETQQLALWIHEEEKEKRRCPRDQGGCGGTRCVDWRFNGRVCGDDPSTADEGDKLIGGHFSFSVKVVPSGWWPLPKTHLGKIRRDLWDKVADHCQISLARPVGVIP